MHIYKLLLIRTQAAFTDIHLRKSEAIPRCNILFHARFNRSINSEQHTTRYDSYLREHDVDVVGSFFLFQIVIIRGALANLAWSLVDVTYIRSFGDISLGKLVKNCYEYGIHTGRASLDVGTERSNGQV